LRVFRTDGWYGWRFGTNSKGQLGLFTMAGRLLPDS
jgi:hypothetical protein